MNRIFGEKLKKKNHMILFDDPFIAHLSQRLIGVAHLSLRALKAHR